MTTPRTRAGERATARLAAVQALYQMDMAGTGVGDVLAEFLAHWIGREVEGVRFRPAEVAFFETLVRGVLADQAAIDEQITAMLRRDWPLARIDAVMRAILRAGTFELTSRADVPARVVIAEYCDIGAAFFGREEVGMVNAVLEKTARAHRGAEFAPRAH